MKKSIKNIGKKCENLDLESEVDLGLEGGVEVGEGVVGEVILIALLLDVVFIVFLTDVVDPEQNVDHAHLLGILMNLVDDMMIDLLFISLGLRRK